MNGSDIEHVNEFPFLGLIIASFGMMLYDVDKWITQVPKAFGALCKAVFMDKDMSLKTKRKALK